MSYSNLLNGTCTIETNAATQNDFGELVVDWSDKFTSVPCRRVRITNPNIINVGEYEVTLDDFAFMFMPDVDISRETDRIIYQSETYEILGAYVGSENRTQKVYARLKDL